MRKIHQNIKMLFEPYEWKVVETEFADETNKNNETIFALGNGYIGVRGTFEEGFHGYQGFTNPGTFINGIYEYHDYQHIWCRPGFPETYHCIVNQVEAFEAKIYVNGELVQLDKGKVSDYERTLDMYQGRLTRKFTYTTEDGIRVNLIFERFVSLAEKHTTAMKVTIVPEKDCRITFDSILDGEVKKIDICDGEKGVFLDDCFQFIGAEQQGNAVCVTNETRRSKFLISAAMADKMDCCTGKTIVEDKKCINRYEFQGEKNKGYTLEKATCYTTNRDAKNVAAEALSLAQKQIEKGYDCLFEQHAKEWAGFWEELGISIKGDTAVLQGVRFAMYHLFQSAGRDGITNISANGLTGIGYSGHTFWDTEIFMMPMFLYTKPEIARQLLIYRYNILDNARERARQMEDQGALFAWNSINGQECGHVFEAVTAQYHINCDVYYAIDRYMQVTDDQDFMVNYGAEILFEITKCMSHRGNFIPYKDNKFCINVICGPDEYSPIVDNNCYTNWLCRKQFYYTVELANRLKEEHPEKYKQLLEKCNIDDAEIARWKKAAENMYIPYHEGLELYMQDDQFLYRDPIDIEAIPLEKLPLLTNLHPLNLWRYQVIKQADIVLLMYLCSEDFTPEMKKKIFDFYEPKTIHDSSLSAGIHSIVACDVGYADEAYGYFKQTARMDLDNVNRNTYLGVHSACMGSAWQILTGGFARMRLYHNQLHFNPFKPDEWEEYSFNLNFRGAKLNICVRDTGVTYTLMKGKEITFSHDGETVVLDLSNRSKTFQA